MTLFASHVCARPALTPDLISNVVVDACIRFPVLNKAGKAIRLDQLIEAGAWSDAALEPKLLRQPVETLLVFRI